MPAYHSRVLWRWTFPTPRACCASSTTWEPLLWPPSGLSMSSTVWIYFAYISNYQLKFIYSEKATKFCEIFTLLLNVCTGKSCYLFIELEFNTWKFQAQTWGEHLVYRNCFWHSEQFLYTTCSPHVLQKEELLTKIYLY